MIVRAFEMNCFEQRTLLDELWRVHGLESEIYTLEELHESASLDQETGRLYIDGKEIVVAYFRAGFAEQDYAFEGAWDTRIMIEKSRAIKCPNINIHLAGCKTIQ